SFGSRRLAALECGSLLPLWGGRGAVVRSTISPHTPPTPKRWQATALQSASTLARHTLAGWCEHRYVGRRFSSRPPFERKGSNRHESTQDCDDRSRDDRRHLGAPVAPQTSRRRGPV